MSRPVQRARVSGFDKLNPPGFDKLNQPVGVGFDKLNQPGGVGFDKLNQPVVVGFDRLNHPVLNRPAWGHGYPSTFAVQSRIQPSRLAEITSAATLNGSDDSGACATHAFGSATVVSAGYMYISPGMSA